MPYFLWDCFMYIKILIHPTFKLLIKAAFLLMMLLVQMAHATTLNVTVISNIDQQTLSNQSVLVYRYLTDGSRKGYRNVTTNSQGQFSLDLPNLGNGTLYQLRTLPRYGSRIIYSEKINTAGNFSFNVGNLRIKATDGLTNSIIAHHKITAYIHETDGSLTWLTHSTTDATGFTDLQLPELTGAQQYLFKATNPSTGSTWSSPLVDQLGLFTFIIGEKLFVENSTLDATITSGIDHLPLANQDILVYKRLADGSRKRYRKVTTDNQGQFTLDLPDLGDDTPYRLRTLPRYGSRVIYSEEITHSGYFNFNVGNIRIKAVDGRNNAPIIDHKITAYIHEIDGTNSRVTHSNTQNLGFTDFQLPPLVTGQQYLFKTTNPSTGHTWTSDLVSQSDSFTFIVGEKLFAEDNELSVTVTSGIDNVPLANQPVLIYQILSDGSLKGYRNVTTNNLGQFSSQLLGLGSGTSYRLRTLPKHGNRVIYSNTISTSSHFAFKVGNMRIKAIDGQTNNIIANHKITAFLREDTGSNTRITHSHTDSSGFTDFQLPQLTAGQKYIFKATNNIDGSTWSSNLISTLGISPFVIGNQPLHVSLINALTTAPLSNIKVTAYLRMPDNSLKWTQEKLTNTQGQLDFYLPSLGHGSQYVLSAHPYGVKILSQDLTSITPITIQAGAIAVTLRKKINGSIIQGALLRLYEKVSPGTLKWRATSTTDESGNVYFDPQGLGTGKIFVIKGTNLLNQDETYYSQWILTKGPFNFSVDLSDPHHLDEEAPIFQSFAPSNNSTLAQQGFTVKVQATDNNRISHIHIRVIDPSKGSTLGQAIFSNNQWHFPITSDMISSGKTITIEAQAIDQVGNIATLSHQYSIINDIEKPQLNIESHSNNNFVTEQGFLLTGNVTDNSGYVKLLATVVDPIQGILIDQKQLEIGKNHHWALVSKHLSRGKNITVTLQATDSANNVTTQQLTLSVTDELNSTAQLLNRITFGATPRLLKELRDNGVQDFIDQQLHPELIDDSSFEALLENLLTNDTGGNYQKLTLSQVARATSSKRQLLEIMTQFWESHFNTDLAKTKSIKFEKQENNSFRQHALGNFRDLLQISATSPAMLLYLDNNSNHMDEPNENYARELLELHTLGVQGGYTPSDIVETARTFTGWRISQGVFHFNHRIHNDDEKIILGHLIPANSGIEGGAILLDILSTHSATAEFICTKLLTTFVSNLPTQVMISHCATDFLQQADQDNQIAQVLKGIFDSPEFSAPLSFHNKVKNPFEFLVSLYRQLPIAINYSKTQDNLSSLGMPLFLSSPPTGWPEKNSQLINSNHLMQRWDTTNNILFNATSASKTHLPEPSQFFINQNIETTEAVLGYLFELTLAHDYSQFEWDAADAILTNNQTETFDIYAPTADIKLRNLMSLIMKYPAYQLQ